MEKPSSSTKFVVDLGPTNSPLFYKTAFIPSFRVEMTTLVLTLKFDPVWVKNKEDYFLEHKLICRFNDLWPSHNSLCKWLFDSRGCFLITLIMILVCQRFFILNFVYELDCVHVIIVHGQHGFIYEVVVCFKPHLDTLLKVQFWRKLNTIFLEYKGHIKSSNWMRLHTILLQWILEML